MVSIQYLPTRPERRNSPFNLVGETVRYLLSAPPSPNDRKHQIRLIWGNGLSFDIWEKFQVCLSSCAVGVVLSILYILFDIWNTRNVSASLKWESFSQAPRGYLRLLHTVGAALVLELLGIMDGFYARNFMTYTYLSKLMRNRMIFSDLPRQVLPNGGLTMKAGRFSSSCLQKKRGLATGVPRRLQTRNWPETSSRKGISITALEMHSGGILMAYGILWTALVSV